MSTWAKREVTHLVSWGIATWVAALVAASRVFVHILKTDLGFWKCAGSVKVARGWDDRALSDEKGIVSGSDGRCLKLRPSCRRGSCTILRVRTP